MTKSLADKFKEICTEFKKVHKYNMLMRYSFSAKGILRPEDQAALEELKEYYGYAHTAQVSVQFADKLLLEYEALVEENEKLKDMLSKPKRFLGVF